MTSRALRRGCALGLMLGLSACDDASKPADPVWGKQPCAACSMLVSERRFAAELATIPGERLFFDDVGCLVNYIRERKPAVRALWVHDGSRWLDARSARFARGERTPMDYGFAASPTGDATFADVEHALAEPEPDKGERR